MGSDNLTHAREYIEAGWSLCAIKPSSKQPYGTSWETRPRSAGHWEKHPDDGMGLIHGLSGTCSIDLDDLECATIALRAVGVDIEALLAAPDAVRIIGKPGRGKLLYRTPIKLERTALNWPDAETGKRFAVLELRGGSVQDVLPPSIHPDTLEPYRWEGDWRNLPDLPPELLDVWTHWPQAKRDMEAACPWYDPPEAPADRYAGVTRRVYGEGESVIAAFNAAHQLRQVLESLRYRRAGVRYISPYSSSGIPGVVILPGSEGRLCYVHHASDPLADGHSHDAFSVFCQLEHGGDVTRAVKAAAEMLGISHAQVEDKEGAAIAARIMGPRVPPPPSRPDPKPSAPLPDLPDDPIPVPALAELERWLRLRHHGAKRVATTQGALAFGAAMAARRYVGHDGEPANVLLGVTDTSIAGLRPIKGSLYYAADASGERKIIRGTKVSSEATIHRALLRCPRMFWVADDYGYMVAMSRRQPSGALESALAALQETYTGTALYLDPETVGAKKEIPLSDCTIQAPAVVTLALVSEDQMREITRRTEYGRGAVQQFLFARADDHADDEAGRAPNTVLPKNVVDGVHALRTVEHRVLGGLVARATNDPNPISVDLGPGTADALEEARAGLRLIFHGEQLARWRGIAHGAYVTVRRLSISLAAWADPERPILHADIVRWVGRWVIAHVARSVEWYDAISSDDGDPDLISDIRGVLYSAGVKGATSREIAERCRAYRRLPVNQRSELLEQMVEDGLCLIVASGRTNRYVDRAHRAPADDAVPAS